MKSVGIYEARASLSKLVERALSGEEVVITRRGKPAVRLVPAEDALPPRKPGALKGLFEVTEEFFEPLPEDVLAAFYESSIEPEEEEEEEEEGPEADQRSAKRGAEKPE
jgi:prevent-host-death family protein